MIIDLIISSSRSRESYGISVMVASIVGLCCYMAYNYFFHPMAKVRGPFLASVSPLWIISTLRRRRVSPDIAELHERYGPIVRIAPNEISFATIEALNTIYHGVNPIDGVFSKQGTLQDIITNFILPGPNIITMHDRTLHRAVKTRIEPAFTPRALFQQEPIMKAHLQTLCAGLDAMIGKNRTLVNITENVSAMLWNMVSDLAFGEPLLEGQRGPFEQFVENCTGMFQLVEGINHCLPVVGGCLRIFLESIPFPVTSGHILEANKLRKCMEKEHERKDFLTAIMGDARSSGLHLTDRELQSNAAALFMAGYGTTAISISGILYQILREPSHFYRLKEELYGTFQSADEIEGSQVQHLPWLNACINESLRLLPPINTRFAGRTSPGAVISGLFVPAGVSVFADIFTIQRSDEYWAKSKEFHPERWLENDRDSPFAKDVKAAFKPFLLGTRACIGKQMALQTLRLVLANLAFRYDFEMVNKDDFVWERDVPSSLVWTDYKKVNVRLSKATMA